MEGSMVVDPAGRMTCDELLDHSYFDHFRDWFQPELEMLLAKDARKVAKSKSRVQTRRGGVGGGSTLMSSSTSSAVAAATTTSVPHCSRHLPQLATLLEKTHQEQPEKKVESKLEHLPSI